MKPAFDDVDAQFRPSSPWASMVLHLEGIFCGSELARTDAVGNVAIPLTNCQQLVQSSNGEITIDLLSVTMGSIVFVADHELSSASKVELVVDVNRVYRHRWRFTVQHCDRFGDAQPQYRYEASLDNAMGIDEFRLPDDMRHNRLDRRSRRCRRRKQI